MARKPIAAVVALYMPHHFRPTGIIPNFPHHSLKLIADNQLNYPIQPTYMFFFHHFPT